MTKTFSLLTTVILSFPFLAHAQNGNWTAQVATKRFIENKGQFDGKDKLPGSKILYGIDRNGTQIYFTKEGLSYRFDAPPLKREVSGSATEGKNTENLIAPFSAGNMDSGHGERQGRSWEEEERSAKIITDIVHLYWENSNPDVEIIAKEQTEDYFSYCLSDGENINHIKGFKKLIYKNLYPNIDAEYIFPPSPSTGGENRGEAGIKYSIIIHPGADASQVKIIYSKNISADANGNIRIATKFGDIIDHAPLAFYQYADNASIASSFKLKNNTVTFELENYDHSNTVIIDPWVQTPTLPNSNGVWECEHDGAGNVYIIGGDMPMKLLKYNSAGAIQWTYSTPWDTTNNWLGTLATDFAGNSYVTSGSIAAMQKINSSGGLVWNYTAPAFSVDEYWTISFNCDQTMLVVGGTTGPGFPSTNLQGAIFNINTANGNIIGTPKIVGAMFNTIPPYINEVRTMSSSKNARYYYLTLDTIGCIDQNLSSCSNGSPIFAINSGYSFGYKCENFRPNNGNAGIKSIRANGNFVYTQNGTNIQKRSLTTGTVITTVPISGGISTSSLGRNSVGNSGIDIDTCGNVYVGSGNAVIKYDANLNLISSVALPFAVYDVSVSTNGDVIVAGATGTSASVSRTGYVQSIASFAACNPLALQCCNANVCNAGPFCSTDPPQTLISSAPGGTWSGTGITNPSTGVFDPSVSGTGTFVITYTLPCGSGSITIVVNNCTLPTICIESNGDLTVSGGAGPTYTWQVQGTANDCSQCFFPALCQPPAPNCPIIVTTWTTYSTTATATPPGTWPIRVIDANGNVVTLNSTAGLPPCSSVLTASTNHINVLCNGQCTGTATVTVTNGTLPYTYNWSNGQSTSAITGLCAGTYSVLVSDAASVTATATVTITQPATALTATASATSPSCASGGTATAIAAGGSPLYTYLWNPGGQTTSAASGLPAGNYTATVTDANGCTTTATVSIAFVSGGTVSVNSSTILCNGGTATAAAVISGGTFPFTYLWSGGQTTSSVTGISAGNYSVTVTDANGCTSTATLSITQPPALTTSVSVTGTTCGNSTGTAAITVTGGTPSYTYLWSNGATTSQITNLTSQIYSVTITDANGCTQITTANILNTNAPQPIVTGNNVSCYGGNNGSASVSVTGGSPPYTYIWNPGGQSTTASTGLSAGTYTVIVSDATGCSNMQTVTITQPPSLNANASASPGVIAAGNSAQLNSSGGITYSWVPTTGLSNPNISGPVASPSQTTEYCVYVFDALGCYDSACVTVFVQEPLPPCTDNYYIPNAFSPNGDNENDALKVYGINPNCVKEFKLIIYDRWGEKVFSTINPAEIWDGLYNGKIMSTQVLTYYLHIIFIDGKEINKPGNVSVVR